VARRELPLRARVRIMLYLRVRNPGARSLREIAESTGVPLSTVSLNVQKLQEEGLVELKEGRYVLTEKGREYADSILLTLRDYVMEVERPFLLLMLVGVLISSLLGVLVSDLFLYAQVVMIALLLYRILS